MLRHVSTGLLPKMSKKFNSLVCVDLETTGLPQYERVRITEIALLGIVRAHVDLNTTNGRKLPRVTHKLSFSVYPNKQISLGAAKVSGLSNELLESIQPWNEESVSMLQMFLNQLPQPVCLVAHNGIRFDFPILQAHLKSLSTSLRDDVLCCDSLPAFMAIIPEMLKSSMLIENMKQVMTSNNEELFQACEKYEKEQEKSNYENVSSNQKQIETTPKSRHVSATIPSLTTKAPKMAHPEVCESVRRCLFPEKRPISYKLSGVYQILYQKEPDSVHDAEGDSTTLLKCILKTAPSFFKWADENCRPFSSIKEC